MNMKRYFLLSSFILLAMLGWCQQFDVEPTVRFANNNEDVVFILGGRFSADAAFFHTDATEMQNGATISDSRIKTGLKYGEHWKFSADFGFARGKFSQKDIFIEYYDEKTNGGHDAFKVGYFYSPGTTMAQLISTGSLHFIFLSGAASSFFAGRQLGATYKYYNSWFYTEDGVFVENANNNYEHGNNGYDFAGRWLLRKMSSHTAMHIGARARFSHVGGGEERDLEGKSVLCRSLTLSQPLESYVDNDSRFMTVTMPWVNNVIDLGVEAHYHNSKMFARGEYMYKSVTKDTQKAKSMGEDVATDNYQGGYVEAGYQIFGNGYKYDADESLMKGNSARSLEVVGRAGFTNLTNKNDGGKLFSATIGMNYSFNKYAQVMLDYTYHRLDNKAFPEDKNIHMLQTRMQFVF